MQGVPTRKDIERLLIGFPGSTLRKPRGSGGGTGPNRLQQNQKVSKFLSSRRIAAALLRLFDRILFAFFARHKRSSRDTTRILCLLLLYISFPTKETDNTGIMSDEIVWQIINRKKTTPRFMPLFAFC